MAGEFKSLKWERINDVRIAVWSGLELRACLDGAWLLADDRFKNDEPIKHTLAHVYVTGSDHPGRLAQAKLAVFAMAVRAKALLDEHEEAARKRPKFFS